MPYDPRMMQMAQMGVGMMGPQQGGRPKQWWEQPMPGRQMGQPADPSKPDDPNAPKQQQPSLLQMLMLGGKPTYSGTPTGGSTGGSPWGMLGSMGMPGGGGYGR